MTESQTTPKKKSLLMRGLKGLFRWTGRGIVLLLLLLLIAWLAIQTPWAQNKLVREASSFLSKELKTKVEVGYVNIDFFDRLVLEKVYIEDLNHDTLAYLGKLKADIAFFSALDSRLELDEVRLLNPIFFLKRPDYGKPFNIDFLADYFSSSDTTSTSKPFFLTIRRLRLKNARFHMNDVPGNSVLDIHLAEGDVLVKSMDMQNGPRFELEELLLDRPNVKMRTLTWKDDPPRTKPRSIEADTSLYPLAIKCGMLRIKDGLYYLDDDDQTPFEGPGMDFPHIRVRDIQIRVDSFDLEKCIYRGSVKNLSCLEERSNFKLDGSSAKKVELSENNLLIYGLNLKTPETILSDTFTMRYNDYGAFRDFPNQVVMEGKIKPSKVKIKDIMTFAADFYEIPFFVDNQELVADIGGRFKGTFNNLRGRELDIRLATGTHFKGDFTARDLQPIGNEYLSIECRELKTNTQDISSLLPKVKVPSELSRLGKLDFKGNFTGFPRSNFTAYGNLITSLGEVSTDLTMSLSKDPTRSTYNGKVKVQDFDLGKLLQNPDFGLVNLEGVVDGKGLTGESVQGKLDGTIKNFIFKGYSYHNLSLKGKVDKKNFEGTAIAHDENIDLVFNGNVNLNGRIPRYKFVATLNKMDFQKLKITPNQEFSLAAKCDIDFQGKDLDDFLGKAFVYDIQFYKGKRRIPIDSLTLFSKLDTISKEREVQLVSKIVEASAKGRFRPSQLLESVLQLAEKNYPAFASKLNLVSKKQKPELVRALDGTMVTVTKPLLLDPQEVIFSGKVTEGGPILQIFDSTLISLADVALGGYYNSEGGLFEAGGTVGKFQMEQTIVQGVDFSAKVMGNALDVNAHTASVQLSDSLIFPGVTLRTSIATDTLAFDLNIGSPLQKQLSEIAFGGQLFFEDDLTVVKLTPQKDKRSFTLFGQDFRIADDNYIKFKKDYIDIYDLCLSSPTQYILVASNGVKGLRVNVRGVDLAWMTGLIPNFDRRFKFSGTLHADASIEDVFKLRNAKAHVRSDSLFINGDHWGKLDVFAESEKVDKQIDLNRLTLVGLRGSAIADGYFRFPDKGKKNDYLEVNAKVESVDLLALGYLLRPEAENMVGTVTGEVKIWGHPAKLDIKGKAEGHDAAATIGFTRCRYFADIIKVNIDSKGFHIFGNEKERTIRDERGNTAIVEGKVFFKHLNEFGAQIFLTTTQMMVLNTTKKDFDLFYGTAIAQGVVEISGRFDRNVDMYINMRTRPGSFIDIPISDEEGAEEASFVKFVDKKLQLNKPKPKEDAEVYGLNLNMDLTLTPDAECRLLFDEKNGEIMAGRGRGDLNIAFNAATLEYSMYGDYTIQKGSYRFNYNNIISKDFEVREGGTIRWSGSPFEAQLNIDAYYGELYAAPYDLISDLVASDAEAKSLARTTTKVDLGLKLTGPLSHPDISFSLDLPRLDPRVKRYTDSRLRTLREDKNALNGQVFGLVVLKRFLPNNSIAQDAGNNALSTGVNTVSEVISGQLSMYMSDLLNTIVGEVGIIDNINADLNLIFTDNLSGGGQTVSGNNPQSTSANTAGTFRFALTPSLLDGRMTVRLGGNVDFGNGSNVQTYSPVGADILVEYKIDREGKFRIKAYSRTENRIASGTQWRAGLGFALRLEFDDFGDIFKKKKR